MSAPTIIPGDLRVGGNLIVAGTRQETARSGIAQEQLAVYPIPWEAWRVWDAYQTALPGTAATDDLALIGGTFGTSSPSLQTEDLKAAGATNKYARCMLWLPPEYEAGQTIQFRFRAGMLTNVADTTATLDVDCYASDSEAGIGSNLYSGSALSINSLTLADKDFTLNPATLAPGTVLDLRITMAINDGATGTAVQGIIGAAALLMDIRG